MLRGVSDPETRYERFLWLLRTFAPDEGERLGGNQRALARLIGKTGKKEAYFTAKFSEMRKKDSAGVDGATMMQIMRATGVNPMWLLHGEGPRLLDARSEDIELSTFMTEVLANDALREAAQRAHATVEEARALLRLARQRRLLTFAPKLDDGKIDWDRAFELQRSGALNADREQSELGAEAAKAKQERENGALPKTAAIPAPPQSRPRPRKR